ncbi:MAG: cytochrome b6-f complex subunit PetL [Oculatellaceae cyanobacterium bins.114]|nr:cytochrome b6-f complex subunit PetL [Oculatellaceae cyanobacterium bins.114]
MVAGAVTYVVLVGGAFSLAIGLYFTLRAVKLI